MGKKEGTGKATHKGTCQICGRLQKLPRGRLSKHGYTKQWGFFSGTCWGAEGKPFEESTDLIERAVADAGERIVQLTKQVAIIRNRTDGKAWVRFWHPHLLRNHVGGYRWEYVTVREETVAYHDGSGSYNKYYVKAEKKDAEEELTVYERTTLEELVKKQNETYIGQVLEAEIKDMEKYIAWQTGRIKNWKPSELKAI